MVKKSTIKRITTILILTLTFNSLPPLKVFDQHVLAQEELSTYLNSDNELNDLSDEALSDDFDLEEAVEETPSVHEMTEEERALFDQIVEEQVALYDGEEKELYAELLTDFFDESTEHSGDLEHAQEVLQEAEEEDPYSTLDVKSAGILSLSSAKSAKIKLGNRFVGATINIAIGVAVGGGVGAIKAYITKRGKKEAQKVFTKTVSSRLIAWGAPKLAVGITVIVAYALEYLDVGNYIARQLDKRDKYPNNGWVDIY